MGNHTLSWRCILIWHVLEKKVIQNTESENDENVLRAIRGFLKVGSKFFLTDLWYSSCMKY